MARTLAALNFLALPIAAGRCARPRRRASRCTYCRLCFQSAGGAASTRGGWRRLASRCTLTASCASVGLAAADEVKTSATRSPRTVAMRAQARRAMRPSVPRLRCCTPTLACGFCKVCKIEPSLVTDSSEASKDGREACDERAHRSRRLGQALQTRAVQLRLRRARCGQPHETRR